MKFLSQMTGTLARHKSVTVRIVHAVSFSDVLVEPLDPKGPSYIAPVNELSLLDPQSKDADHVPPDITELKPQQRLFLDRWLPIIRPLAEAPVCTLAMVRAAATDAKCSPALIRKYVRRLRDSGRATGFLPRKRGRPGGSHGKYELIIPILIKCLQEYHGKEERPPLAPAIDKTITRCKKARIKVPSVRHLYRIARDLDPRDMKRRRYSRKEFDQTYAPRPNRYAEATAPLDVVQIDHTRVDLIVLDEETRQPIRRPWLTLGIDIYSRCIVCCVLTARAPRAATVALAIAQAILPKEDLLARLGVEGVWPIYGMPRKISVDGGADLNALAIQLGCAEHGITLFKREGGPHLGGHIERLMGTVMGKVHLLPGTTFSNVKKKGDYPSEKRAIMTMAEANLWLTEQVLAYHVTLHRGIGETPLERYERAVFGTADKPGSGLPPRPQNADQLFIDFLDFSRRRVTRRGITWDNILYWDSCLTPFIGDKRKFLCRRDPDDIGQIWVRLKTGQPYERILFSNRANPSVALDDVKRAKKQLRAEGASTDEASTFRRVEKIERIEREAAEKTKKARHHRARRKWQKENPARAAIVGSAEAVRRQPAAADATSPPRQKRWFGDIADMPK